MSESLVFIAYARRSSEGETKQIESIGDQVRSLRPVIEEQGLKVVRWFTEDKSAMHPHKRPVFREMLDMIIAGKANALLCWHVERLARNPLEWGELQQLLGDGVIQRIKTPEREYRPGDDMTALAIAASEASEYSRRLRREVSRGASGKAERGWYPYSAKHGYVVDLVTKEIDPDPVRFPLILAVLEQIAARELTPAQGLVSLNANGYRTRRYRKKDGTIGGDKPMSRATFYRLLTDRFYTGRHLYRGEEFVGRHRPMITDDQYRSIQRVLGRPLRDKYQKHFHLFAGMIVCGVCGCQITAETQFKEYKTTGGWRSYTYYHCTGRRGCDKRSVTEAQVEQTILRQLEGIQFQPEFVDFCLGVLDREGLEWKAMETIRSTEVPASASRLARKLERLKDMREDEEISREEFIERKERYQSQLEEIKREETERVTKRSREEAKLREVLTFRRDAYHEYTKGRPEEKRRVLRAFSDKYVLTLGELTVIKDPALEVVVAFEPPKNRTSQVQPRQSGAHRLTWRAGLDELRKSVRECKNPFPHPDTKRSGRDSEILAA